MFGLSFLFGAALWALPLAGVPVLLHLLFRRKSPVVPFSTLRFIKASIQRTAARKRVQRWLLLACRALLVGLLIWAVAQPAKMLASGWIGGGSAVAAVVVDTSYSMQLQDGQLPLLARADAAVQDLLRDSLKDAKAAVFRSQPPPTNAQKSLQDAGTILSEWTPLTPQPNPRPLADRVAAAVSLLSRQTADKKRLVVISDFQSNEFPHPVPVLEGGQVVLIDLHPDAARSAGVTRVQVRPAQPIPGLPSDAVVDLLGRPADARAVQLKITGVDENVISQSPPQMATLDAAGHATARFPIKLPAQRWLMLTAELTAGDDMAWDNSRSQLVEVPTKRQVTLIAPPAAQAAAKFIRLALDPSEGRSDSWPVAVKTSADFTGKEDVVIDLLTTWPAQPQAERLRSFARAGGTIILLLRPGLEAEWSAVPEVTRTVLQDLLPAAPAPKEAAATWHAAVATAGDPLLEGLSDDKFQLTAIIVRRLVPLVPLSPSAGSSSATTILNAVPTDPSSPAKIRGLFYRQPVGAGTCLTLTTIPDPRDTNLATHPVFLPLLVWSCLRPPASSAGQNVELGQPIVLNGGAFPAENEMALEGPQHDVYRIKAVDDPQAGRQFIFDAAGVPGLYTWRKAGDTAVAAMSNVQLPASESDLTYRPAAGVVNESQNAMVVRSVAEMTAQLSKAGEPQPHWSGPIAIVLFLLCLEALMGSISHLWKPGGMKAIAPAVSTN